jgi:nitrate reductase NapA
MKQWEVSFNAYKKSIIQYDLDFVARRLIVDDNENINTFKEKLKLLANKYIRGNHNITSYWASGINKRKDALNTNILLHSLHLLTNKHSRPGCGALSLAGQSSTQGTSIELGTFSHTLPANMFLKYTEHRIKTEQIWKLPNGTLNPISNENYNDLHDNIISGLTKFVWINNANPYQSTPNNIPYINKVKALKDLFIVTSDCFLSYSAQLSDLILPSASNLEKIAAFGNDERKTQFSKQKFLPYGNSMSDLWQCVEFSKKFDIKTLWGSSQIQNNQKIKSVLQTARQMGYKNNTSIYKVLFKNPSLKEHLIDNKLELNTEVLSDKRFQKDDLIDSFYGYDYFIQKYFHNEYKRFGFGVSYDMVDFFEKRKNLQWPVINKKGTKYRFNIKYDKYAYTAQKTNSKFVFYGKLGDKNLKFGNLTEITKEEKYSLKNKAKIFSITSSELAIKKNEEYPYLLTSVKILEHSNTGTITRNIQSLAKEESNAFCYINKETAKKHLLKTNDFIYIESEIGNVKVKVKVNDRVIPLVNTIAVTSFDNKVLINTITKEINNTFVKIYKI